MVSLVLLCCLIFPVEFHSAFVLLSHLSLLSRGGKSTDFLNLSRSTDIWVKNNPGEFEVLRVKRYSL